MSAAISLPTGQVADTTLSTRSYKPHRPPFSDVQVAATRDTRPAFDRTAQAKWPTIIEAVMGMRHMKDDWDTYGGHSPDASTILYAVFVLGAFWYLGLTPPAVAASGNGEILASWTDGGVEVELWFQGSSRHMVVIDDRRRPEKSYAGDDPLLARTREALFAIPRQ